MNESIWKPLQYCYFQCPYGLFSTILGTEYVCKPFSIVTVQHAKQTAPPVMATPEIGYILSYIYLDYTYITAIAVA